MTQIRSNRANVNKKIGEDFKDMVLRVGVEATKIISEPRQWAGFSDVRDIVDLGQLRAAQQIIFVDLQGKQLIAEIRYPVEYSAAVHNGATIRYPNGNTRRIVGRPFLRMAAMRIKR